MTATTEPRPLEILGRLVLLVVLGIGLMVSRFDLFSMFFYLCYASVGAILAYRRPRNVIGWLLVGIGFGFALTTTPTDVDLVALAAGTASWPDFLTAWVSAWIAGATFSGFVFLMVLFPSGRLPAGRWRRPAIALLAMCAAVTLSAAIAPVISFNTGSGTRTISVPNRFAILPDLALWDVVPVDAFILPMVVFLAIGVISMLVRFRRATGVERLQLRWLVAALAFVVLAVTGGLGVSAVFGDLGGLEWLGAIVAFPTVPAAIYVAITRYRLYEIDRVISRTLGWVIVTAILAGQFAIAIVGLQAILAPVTENNTIAVAASTLVAFALFQPLRRRVQRAVDRRFDRARYDGERVVTAFGERLRDRVDLAGVETDIAVTVHEALRPGSVAVWVRTEAGG